MLIVLLTIFACSAVSGLVLWPMLSRNPYHDIPAPMPYAVEIPNLTFDHRGFA